MPHLVQILLPTYDNNGRRFAANQYNEVRAKLTDNFGGLTAYTRAPAQGFWNTGNAIKRDDILVVEVMVESLDRQWWTSYKRALEKLFQQEDIVVRAQTYEAL